MQIERKAEDCYKAEYARAHIGEHRAGTISGVPSGASLSSWTTASRALSLWPA